MENYVMLGLNLLICVATITSVTADPCTSYTELPRAEYRGGNCTFNSEKEVCDRTLISGWYRAVGISGDLQMQDTEAQFATCGTKFPFWMNGTHPAAADGEVIRNVCRAGILSSCDEKQTISVKNCGTYYVYNLTSLSSCPLGYCFGATDPCPPFDPCDIYENTRVDYDPGRASICNQGGNSNCDNFNTSTWFSFRDNLYGYLNISTQCPGTADACGTRYPLYINGSDSSTVQADGSIQTDVCEQNHPTCCNRAFTIWSKECTGFKVYKFPSPPAGTCNRYCLDDSTATCPSTTLAQSTSQASLGETTTANVTGEHTSEKQNNNENDKVPIIVGTIVGIVFVAVTVVVAVKMNKKQREAKIRDSQEKITTAEPDRPVTASASEVNFATQQLDTQLIPPKTLKTA